MIGKIDLTKLRTPEIKRNERIAAIRKRRDELLTQFDAELYRNGLHWAELSPEQRVNRNAYRKQLLDITKQAGFPDDIIWPVIPA